MIYIDSILLYKKQYNVNNGLYPILLSYNLFVLWYLTWGGIKLSRWGCSAIVSKSMGVLGKMSDMMRTSSQKGFLVGTGGEGWLSNLQSWEFDVK